MKIESSVMALSASSAQSKTHSVTEQLNAWADGQQQGSQAGFKDDVQEIEQSAIFSISTDDAITFEISATDKIKINLLNKMLEALTGKKMRFFLPKKIRLTSIPSITYTNPLQQGQPAAARKGWGISYQRQEYTAETASMDFNAEGIVKTSDGKTLRFNLDMSLSRAFVSEDTLSIKAGDALIDPIVVNFDAPSAQLTAQKFQFDLDSDGREDSMSFVKSGSGFLVFDKNGDGTINNGGEMFGPSTGNGFMELKAFDTDGNGWIDENDPVYDRLQIWTKDENGQDRLFAIGQKGIGAIYLGSVSSAFELKDDANALQGKIQRTGVFLRENGTAGTLQHVDLSI